MHGIRFSILNLLEKVNCVYQVDVRFLKPGSLGHMQLLKRPGMEGCTATLDSRIAHVIPHVAPWTNGAVVKEWEKMGSELESRTGPLRALPNHSLNLLRTVITRDL